MRTSLDDAIAVARQSLEHRKTVRILKELEAEMNEPLVKLICLIDYPHKHLAGWEALA